MNESSTHVEWKRDGPNRYAEHPRGGLMVYAIRGEIQIAGEIGDPAAITDQAAYLWLLEALRQAAAMTDGWGKETKA